MELADASIVASTQYLGNDDFTLSAGKRIQIRDNESGSIVNRLDVEVPAGKSWEVHIHMTVKETDA